MAKSNVSAVTKYFATVNEGFTTTISSTIAANAAIVPLSSVSGLVDASVFVGIIEPGDATKEQVFTGTVDVTNSRITGCIWTRGTSASGHAGGVTVVDYTTGTAFNMFSAGILKQHKQSGAHAAVTADSITTTSLTVAGKDISQFTPTGLVNAFAGSSVPTGWLLCDGSAVSRTTYAALFAAISTSYGTGNGTTTFNLPDGRGRALFGYDSGQSEFNAMGKTGGQKVVQAHNHNGSTDGAGSHDHASNTSGQTVFTAGSTNTTTTASGFQQITWGNTRTDTNGFHAHSFTTSTSGSGTNNLNPYTTVNYIIKT